MTRKWTSFEQHLQQQRTQHGVPDAEVATLLACVATSAKRLSRHVRRAAIEGSLGLTGEENITGDAQKKLDVIGDETVIEAFRATNLVAAVVSEELDEARPLSAGEAGRYVLCIDPIDGSSNTDINGAMGTIFGIYQRSAAGPIDATRDLMRAGSEQIASGYVMYGPATLLVYTTGKGAHGFTLDLESDDFLMTHPSIRCPERGSAFSANTARFHDWHPGIQTFVTRLSKGEFAAEGGKARPYSLRYTGALVADLHRSLMEGGIYFYPADPAHKNGKLRLLYECAPLAFVVEQAGGRATTGTKRILDVRAETIHQRCPIAIGGPAEVAFYEKCIAEAS